MDDLPRSKCDAKSDKQLVRETRAGCLSSFGALAQRYQTRLLHFLLHRLNDRDLAEDVVQDTLLQAYRHVDQYDDRWEVSTWLFTICRRLAAKSSLRAARRQCEGMQNVDVLDFQQPSDNSETDELRTNLWTVVRQFCSNVEFTALWLFYVEQMPLPEVARVLEKTHAATKVTISRARAKLRPHLSKLNHELRDTQASGQPTRMIYRAIGE